MADLAAHGVRVRTPNGWDAEIYRRGGEGNVGGPQPSPLAVAALAADDTVALDLDDLYHGAIVHLSTFPLPPTRGDFGGGALAAMGSYDVFVSLFEYAHGAASSDLFRHEGLPWPLAPDDFDPSTIRVALPDQSGCQRFFRIGERAFTLYAVLGNHSLRRLTVPLLNRALTGITLT